MFDIWEANEGPIRIADATREQLLQIVAGLSHQLDVLRKNNGDVFRLLRLIRRRS